MWNPFIIQIQATVHKGLHRSILMGQTTDGRINPSSEDVNHSIDLLGIASGSTDLARHGPQTAALSYFQEVKR